MLAEVAWVLYGKRMKPLKTKSVPRQKQQLNETTWAAVNPLELDAGSVAQLHDLVQAKIDIISAFHYIQEGMTQLIRPNRVMSHSMIYMPVSGRIEWRSGERCWTVEPGQVILAGAGQSVEAVCLSRHFEVISVHAHIRLPLSAPDQPLFEDMVQDLAYPEFWRHDLETVVSLVSNPAFESVVPEFIRRLLMELVIQGVELTPHRRQIDPRVDKAMELIRKHVASPQVLANVCREMKISDSRLRALFRRDLGFPPKTYHRQTRVREAMRLLGQSDLSLKEIAAQLGYSNPQHLEKDFKRDFGLAPGKCRKQ